MIARKLTVLLADDSTTTLHQLRQALATEPDFRVVTVTSGPEVLQALYDMEVDVLVTDIQMPGNEELELLDSPRVKQGHVAVILITGGPSIQSAAQAVRLQAFDYLTKPIQIDYLIQRVRAADAQRRTRALNATILTAAQSLAQLQGPDSNRPAQLHHLSLLSSREREVAGLVAEGVKADEISERLHISRYTVRNHIRAIFSKLGVSSQSELVLKLLRG